MNAISYDFATVTNSFPCYTTAGGNWIASKEMIFVFSCLILHIAMENTLSKTNDNELENDSFGAEVNFTIHDLHITDISNWCDQFNKYCLSSIKASRNSSKRQKKSFKGGLPLQKWNWIAQQKHDFIAKIELLKVFSLTVNALAGDTKKLNSLQSVWLLLRRIQQ